jgi:hypothetical protein
MHEIPASFIQPIYIYLYRSSHAVVGYFLKQAALLFLPFLRNVIFNIFTGVFEIKMTSSFSDIYGKVRNYMYMYILPQQKSLLLAHDRYLK